MNCHIRIGVRGFHKLLTNGNCNCKFFLTFTATPWLDGRHTIFGKVVEGADVLKKLESLGSPSGQPSERVVMQHSAITVVDKPVETHTDE